MAQASGERPRSMIRAHLLRWRPRPYAQRTGSTPRVRPSGAASQLDPSHRPSQRFSDGLLANLQAGVDRIPQPVADQVDRQDREHDEKAGEGGNPPGRSHVVPAQGQVGPPLGGRRLHSHAEEVERGGDQHRPAQCDGGHRARLPPGSVGPDAKMPFPVYVSQLVRPIRYLPSAMRCNPAYRRPRGPSLGCRPGLSGNGREQPGLPTTTAR